MQICDISISNFRGLRSVKLKKAKTINVIVGQNAIGKTTVLEAVRLCKTLLANRTNDEGRQVLINLSSMSIHNQLIGAENIDMSALANDLNRPVELSVSIQLSDEEVSSVTQLLPSLAMMMIQNKLGNSLDNPLAFTQYLSSPEGQKSLQENIALAEKQIGQVGTDTIHHLTLIMDFAQKSVRGVDEYSNAFIALLDRRLPIQKTLFSYFTADRQFPQGEQNLQIGSADAQNQLNSYMANPGLKYARLKQVILQNMAFGSNGFDYLKKEFDLIFEHLLPGKKLHGININPLGLLKVLVQESSSGKVFDIDQMSSGEKGLILTFLFIRTSVNKGGIVLLDEPELHLNSSVQALILPFLKKFCAKELDMQFFICTHSPEIVKAAFEDEECGLYHLRSGDDLTPIYFKDHKELFDVFDRLGNSPADILFTRGNIYVEGVDDQALLTTGFGPAIAGFKVDSLGGRIEIEKDVPILKQEEKAGRLKKVQLFILDNDRKPIKEASTQLVKIHQHDRYCFENFLLDEDIIYDLIKEETKISVGSRALLGSKIEELALSQIESIAMHSVYNEMRAGSLDLRSTEIKGKSLNDVAEYLAEKFDNVKDFLDKYQRETWKKNYVMEVNRIKNSTLEKWKLKNNWRKMASGKKIIDDLYTQYEIRISKSELKEGIMKAMAEAQTDDWRLLDQILRSNLS